MRPRNRWQNTHRKGGSRVVSRAGALVNERKSENPRTEVACVVQPRRAFTIVELLVTISIVALLMGLLMPGLRAAREGARTIHCASNERQFGIGLTCFGLQNNGALPATRLDDSASEYLPAEMMALTTGVITPAGSGPSEPSDWDGLGRLIGAFLGDPRVLFCPCHHGDNPWPGSDWEEKIRKDSPARVYCNYHFIGDTFVPDNETPIARPRNLFNLASGTVIVADGMRTLSDINHEDGANLLREDGSVFWWKDTKSELRSSVPDTAADETPDPNQYNNLWALFTRVSRDRD